MNLKLHRRYKGKAYTIGSLYIDNKYFCDTLEDVDRGLYQTTPLITIKATKIYSVTAIPRGTYDVTLNVMSPKYSKVSSYNFCKGFVPRLLNVPGFEGILIHIGNKPEDTDGCILVGENKVKGQVINSTATFKRLYSLLQGASTKGEKITITIE